jgi:hypothetical protein
VSSLVPVLTLPPVLGLVPTLTLAPTLIREHNRLSENVDPSNAMSHSEELPSAWVSQFDGTDLEDKLHVSAVLATVDAEGWPHLAYLSAGEVLVHSPQRVSVCLWPASRSTSNLQRLGRAVLYAAAAGVVWETKLVAVPRAGTDTPAIFDADVIEVHRHAAPYAEVTALIGFRLIDPIFTVERWQRQIAQMRDPAGLR